MAKPPEPFPPEVLAAFERGKPVEAIKLLLGLRANPLACGSLKPSSHPRLPVRTQSLPLRHPRCPPQRAMGCRQARCHARVLRSGPGSWQLSLPIWPIGWHLANGANHSKPSACKCASHQDKCALTLRSSADPQGQAALQCFVIVTSARPTLEVRSAQTLARMPNQPAALAEYAPSLQQALVRMWRESFEFGVGVTDPHLLAEQAAYFEAEVLPKNSVRLALSAGQLVGFVAASSDSVAQLHVRVGFHRRGIGSQLLIWAKSQSSGSLWLHTFARNTVAQAFYEHHGFRVASRGFEPAWQLEDVKYQWFA